MRARPGLGRSAVLCALVWLAGCSDGYPTEDEALVLAHGMSRDAALEAMDSIGMGADGDARWRYALSGACRLRIESRALSGGAKELDFLAQTFTATVVGDFGDHEHTVVAHPPNEPPARGLRVLAGANWVNATQMKWLIDYFPLVCARSDPLRK